VDWIELAQDRNKWQALVNTVINLPVAKAGNFLTEPVNTGFWRRTLLHGVSYSTVTRTFSSMLFLCHTHTHNKPRTGQYTQFAVNRIRNL